MDCRIPPTFRHLEFASHGSITVPNFSARILGATAGHPLFIFTKVQRGICIVLVPPSDTEAAFEFSSADVSAGKSGTPHPAICSPSCVFESRMSSSCLTALKSPEMF